MEQNPYALGYCNVSEYFNTITQLYVAKNITLETNEENFYIAANSENKFCWIPKKDFVSSKLKNILEQNQMYLKASVASPNRSQKLPALYQILSECAHKNLIYISRNPGFFINQSTKQIEFLSSESVPFLIQNASSGLVLPSAYNFILTMKRNCFQIHSVEAAFLIVMRCLSLLMSLNIQRSDFNFPYILMLSCRKINPAMFSIINAYLKVFNRMDTYIHDINLPMSTLQNSIQNYTNNVFLLNGMIDGNHIRSENINLLSDCYTRFSARNMCVIVSNTVQSMLNQSEYLELDLSNASLPDAIQTINSFITFDRIFISNVRDSNKTGFMASYSENYQKHLSIAVAKFGQAKEQNTYASIMAVKDTISHIVIPFNEKAFSDEFERFVLSLFAKSTEHSSDATTVKLFRNKLEELLSAGKVRLLLNQKSNKEMPANSSAAVIYHENHTLLIPSGLFDSFCTAKPLFVKRALNEQGYLGFVNQNYITKKTIHPPGNASIRMDVYAVNDDIISPELLERLTAKNRLQLSGIRTPDHSDDGIIIGKGINDQPIIWSYAHKRMPNAHLFITGRSGNGKTTFIVQNIHKLCARCESVVIFDISESYAHHSGMTECADIHNTLPVNPLYAYPNESQKECCQRVTDNLASVFDLDNKNYYILLDVLNKLYNNDKIDMNLKEQAYEMIGKNKTLMAVLKFAESFCSKCETWEQILKQGKASVISMKTLHLPYEKATEFLLNDLYSYMENSGSKRIFVVIDEIQNMIQSDASAVIKVLSQGREKGLAMITATQSFLSIPKKFKSMFLQSGVNVFFQPEITAADLIAKQICAGNNWQQVSSALKKLEIAECLVYGSMENHQHQMEPDTLLYCNCNLEQKSYDPNHSSDDENSVIPAVISENEPMINLAFDNLEN